MAGITVRITVDVDNLPKVEVDEGIITNWIENRLNDARNYFISNASGPSPSAPGAWPGADTGRLIGSVDYQAGGREGELFSEVDYAGYLTTGTSKMAARKMLPDALDESLSARPELAELARAVQFTGGG
jgi:hypothetical protein